ncbi:tripartite tricarboxylate transporter TctB family protein [Micromonospora chalcea]|uniref:tripartite tricarboxylate transporter TctB family protein n=1 Tax=Micromonospora chalcea TaxID=1874 RepID=UPI00382861E7
MTGRASRSARDGGSQSRFPALSDIPIQPVPEPSDPVRADDVPRSAADASKSDRAQYVVCVFLALIGIMVVVDATQIGQAVSSTDPLGPRPVPILLGTLLMVVAVVYAVDVARGGVGEPEAGEDVDLATPIDWRTVLLLVAAFLTNAVLIEPLGWVISGTLLFWGTAFALGSRDHVRNLLIAVGLSLITFYTFAIGLGINLPAGVLRGIL